MGRCKQLDHAYYLDLKTRLECAAHGERGALIDAAARHLGVTQNTVYSNLKKVGWSSDRKPRADRGKSKITVEDIQQVSAMMVGSTRATGKQLLSTGTACDILKANGRLSSDASPSTVLREMKKHSLHPRQLSRPSPHVSLRSKHPNHVWQFDVSVCVLFYLKGGGLNVMDRDKFYKNKPSNFDRIKNDRVLRYLVTDHTSGAFYLRYFLRPGEDRETLFEFLLDAFTGRDHPQDPFRGVPFQLIWDAGSANQANLIKDFLDRLR